MFLLIWMAVMLGPTLLAEDAPHFLRAVGILPAATMVVGVGLYWLWQWPRLPAYIGPLAVIMSLTISLVLTIKDYFYEYGQQPTTAYWFETGARDLAESVLVESDNFGVLVDDRFRVNWPSIPFLIGDSRKLTYYSLSDLNTSVIGPDNAIYAWPYEHLDLVAASIAAPALIQGVTGSLAQGDLEPEPYPLYTKYIVDKAPELETLAVFDNKIRLGDAAVKQLDEQLFQVDLYWATDSMEDRQLISFVHLVGKDGTTLAQDDSIPGQGNWPSLWWRPGLVVKDRHIVKLNEKLENLQPQFRVGLYNAYTQENLPVADVDGQYVGESWLLRP